MAEERTGKPAWYAAHTYAGYENKVKTDLEKKIKNREMSDLFFNIVIPMEEQVEIKDGKRKANLKKVFPGYVLIKMIVTEVNDTDEAEKTDEGENDEKTSEESSSEEGSSENQE